jgi:hypothetical protein
MPADFAYAGDPGRLAWDAALTPAHLAVALLDQGTARLFVTPRDRPSVWAPPLDLGDPQAERAAVVAADGDFWRVTTLHAEASDASLRQYVVRRAPDAPNALSVDGPPRTLVERVPSFGLRVATCAAGDARYLAVADTTHVTVYRVAGDAARQARAEVTWPQGYEPALSCDATRALLSASPVLSRNGHWLFTFRGGTSAVALEPPLEGPGAAVRAVALVADAVVAFVSTEGALRSFRYGTREDWRASPWEPAGLVSLAYTADALVAVGTRDTGAGLRMAIWKFDPDHCDEPLPGWPKTIADWTADPALAAQPSRAAAVAVDAHGNIALGANLIVDGKPQRYTAMLTTDGARLWERPGLVGEEVSSVVVTPEPSSLVVAAGWKFTNDNPASTDAIIWRHLPDKSVWTTTLKAPFTADEMPDINNIQSERIRASLFDPDSGALVVVGEREFRINVFQALSRTFVARFAPLGAAIGAPWTSSGDAYPHDAANSIARCGDTLLLGGWTREDDPGTEPQPLIRWIAEDLSWTKRSAEPMPATRIFGAACDREGKVVSAGLKKSAGLDAQVFAFEDPLGARTWYETGSMGDDGAGGLACNGRGFCAWPGFRSVDGKQVAVMRVHHP